MDLRQLLSMKLYKNLLKLLVRGRFEIEVITIRQPNKEHVGKLTIISGLEVELNIRK